MLLVIGGWAYAIAASLFGTLASWHLRRPAPNGRAHLLTAAFAATALWALAAAVGGPAHPLASLAESVRNLAWLGFVAALMRGGEESMRAARPRAAAGVLQLMLALVLGAAAALDVLPPFFTGHPGVLGAFAAASLALRMAVAIGALVLVHNLYTAAAPDARWGIRVPVLALGAMWGWDLNAYALGSLQPEWGALLLAARGAVMTLLVPAFALVAQRQDRVRMRLSRTVTFQTLSLMAIGGYLVAMVLVVRVAEFVGGSFTQLLQMVVTFGMTVTAVTLMPSGRLRAWAKVKVAKHLFQHRYDYRSEWLRFTDTLALGGSEPLDARVAKALAELAGATGGLLLGRDGDGLALAARWNWPTAAAAGEGGAAFADALARTGWIVALDDPPRDDLPVPAWLRDEPRGWAAVPLLHERRLVGVAVLARPRVGRRLDWEDIDLLRIAGRQAASYLAEAQGQQALSEARRFDEFNRRFAFILHDIKNLASQIGLVARNAERHADKPAFRADMVATLHASAAKMNALLERLSTQERGPPGAPRPVAVRDVVAAVVAPRRATHPIAVEGPSPLALADPPRLEQALGHLVQNAVDASADGTPVTVRIAAADGEVCVSVSDRGCGMAAEFVRAELFRPFASTKAGGFGIGAFEARALVLAMGGRLEVESAPGAGSRFTIHLPAVAADEDMMRKRA